MATTNTDKLRNPALREFFSRVFDGTDTIPALDVTTLNDNTLGAKIATGTQAANQSDLATDANGTAIAAAVNNLRDIMVAFGMMAEAE